MPYKNLKILPFNCDYDPKKKYRFVLFRYGLPLQNRELTELQLAIYNYSKQTWDTIYKNGSVINGCNIFINKKDKKIYITEGKIYYDGTVHLFTPSKNSYVTYTGNGIEKFGLKVKEEIISPLNEGFDDVDNSLLDNASGTENYGNEGACRLKVDFEFTKIDENDNNIYIEILELENGNIKKIYTNINYSDLGDQFAHRTYDESGHYIVNGLRLYTEKNPDENYINVKLSNGKAYVKGYEVNIISSLTLPVKKANNTEKLYYIDNEIINKIQKEDFYGCYIKVNSSPSDLKQGNRIIIKDDNSNDILHATISYIDTVNSILYLNEIEFKNYDNTKTTEENFNTITKITDYWNTKYNKDNNETPNTLTTPYTISNKKINLSYQLKEPYFYNINDIDIDIIESDTNYIIDSNNNSIPLDVNVKDVLLCIDSNNNTIYVEGNDYTVSSSSSGGAITFNNIPSGTTYNVVPILIKTITPNQDNYDIITNDNEFFTIKFYKSNKIISFADFHIKKSNNIEIDTEIDLQYYTYKARTDSFCLNKKGELIRIEGEYTHYTDLIIPNIPNDYLPLGYIKFMPNLDYDKTIINEYRIKRLTMNDLNKLYKRITKIEENQSTLALENEIKEGNLVSNLKGILADPIENFTKMDYYDNKFNIGVNLIDNEITLPIYEEIYNTNSDDPNSKNLIINYSNIHLFRYPSYGFSVDNIKSVTKNYLDNKILLLENNKFSGSRNLNPFGEINIPTVTIFPNKDNWIETDIQNITINNINLDYLKPFPILFTQNNIYKNNTKEVVELKGNNIKLNLSKPERNPINVNNRNLIQDDNDKLIKISENYDTYIRSKTISFKGKHFDANKTIHVYFENDKLTSITSDVEGKIEGSFIIPPNRYKSGRKTIKFIQEDDDLTPKKQVEVYYEAWGLKEIYENQIITNQNPPQISLPVVRPPLNLCKKWIKKYLIPVSEAPDHYGLFYQHETYNNTEYYYTFECIEHEQGVGDPLAQSFRFEKDVILSGIEIIFTSIPENDNKDVFLNIGFLNNGYPDSNTIFYTQFISKDEIYANKNIINENLTIYPTFIEFKNPIYIEANKDFFISFGSESTEYEIAISELGQKDIITDEIINKNAYLTGVLFSSSNNLTWTAEQTRDMCFKLYTYKYDITQNTEIKIDLYKNKNTNYPFGFLTNINYIIPQNCNLNFYYSTEIDANLNFKNYKPFIPNKEFHFDINEIAKSLSVKIILNSNDENLSPIIDYDDFSQIILRYFNYNEDSYYVTKEIKETPDYNKVKIILDVCENNSKNFYLDIQNSILSTTNDSEILINNLNYVENTENIGNNWFRKTYTITIDQNNTYNYFKAKLKLKSTSTNYSPILKNIRFILYEE